MLGPAFEADSFCFSLSSLSRSAAVFLFRFWGTDEVAPFLEDVAPGSPLFLAPPFESDVLYASTKSVIRCCACLSIRNCRNPATISSSSSKSFETSSSTSSYIATMVKASDTRRLDKDAPQLVLRLAEGSGSSKTSDTWQVEYLHILT